LVNKSKETKHIALKVNNKSLRSNLLFANKKGIVSDQNVTISPEETLVIEWK